MDDFNVMDFINQKEKKYTTKDLVDIIISNYDSIIDIFKNYYNDSLNDQNIYTKFVISLIVNDRIKYYDLNHLIECKNDIQKNIISDFRIYVCSCAKSTLDQYLFSSLDLTISKDYKIKVNYFDEFNHEIIKKYKEEIKNLLNDYCYFIDCQRNDECIKANQSVHYEIALDNYIKMLNKDNKKFAQSDEFKKMIDRVDKVINNSDEEQNNENDDNQLINSVRISKDEAIRIADNDRNLKNSIFKEWKEKKEIVLGFISLSSFDAKLVRFKDDLAWQITAKSGRWGGAKVENGNVMHMDGAFVEPMSCIVTCDTGEYYFGDDINSDDIHPVD